jgi:hypothetical protein
MFDILKELYEDNLIDDLNLEMAVHKRWISEEEKKQILDMERA